MTPEELMNLSAADIRKLTENPSADTRAEIAGKIASGLSEGGFEAKETGVAADILRLLVRDVAMQVRKSIAINLRDSLNVPRDVVLKLANDENEVSLSLLRHSYLLSEEDLIEIVRSTREVVKLVAIANRDTISSPLSTALIETEIEAVMQTLFENKSAQLDDDVLLANWRRISDSGSLLLALVRRGGLSTTVAEKLYAAVGDELKAHLARTYRLPIMLVEEAGKEAHEWALLGMSGEMSDAEDEEYESAEEVERLVNQLHANKRLSYSLIIRALCTGDIAFFETAMAKLAGVPRISARILMFDMGELGFRAFYEKTRLPEGFYEAVQTLLRISLEETAYGRFRREDFRMRVMARIQSGQYDRTVENMSYLINIIGGQFATAETVA